MKHSRLIRDSLEGLYTLGPDMDKPATNAEKVKRMKQLLKVAMQFSLTDRQREVVQMYYFEGMKVVDIAAELGIGRRVTYKILQVSRKKLEKIKIFLKM